MHSDSVKMDKMKAITERTLVPLGLVMAMAGGIFWFSSMYTQVEAHTSRLNALEDKQAKTLETLYKIREDVAVVRTIVSDRKGK